MELTRWGNYSGISAAYHRTPRHTSCRLFGGGNGEGFSPVYTGLTQVPTRRGERSLRRAASTESAVIRPVRGLSEGIFSIETVKRAESLSTSTVWQLRSTDGLAHISDTVRSGPIPASASAAATLTLAGNPAAASRAVPENTSLGSFSPSTEMPFASR